MFFQQCSESRLQYTQNFQGDWRITEVRMKNSASRWFTSATLLTVRSRQIGTILRDYIDGYNFWLTVCFCSKLLSTWMLLVGFHPFYRPCRPLGWVEVQLYSFLGPSALDGGGGSAPRPGCLYPRERAGTHCTGDWVGPRACLDGRKTS